MDDTISRHAAMEEISKQQTYKMFEGEDALYLDANDVGSVLASLPSAQPVLDRTKISDLLEKIYSIQSVHLSTEGVIAKKYYCKQLWMELFGNEDVPTWID